MRLTGKTWIVAGLVAVVGVVYAPVLTELFRDWLHDPNYSHGLLIPLVSGFFVWRRRNELAAIPLRPAAIGLAGIAGSAALLVVGTAGAETFTQRVSVIVLLASLVLFLAGWRWLRALAFPLAFLLLAVPLPYVLYYSLTGPMQGFAAKAAIVGLNLVGVPAVAQGNVIHLPQTSLEVAEACSGIRSLYAFLALGALLARSLGIPLWGKVIVFFTTIPLSVAANAIRVWGSGVAAYLFGPQAAEGTLHELFGLVVFVAALGVFVLFRKGARALWSSEPSSPPSS